MIRKGEETPVKEMIVPPGQEKILARSLETKRGGRRREVKIMLD